MSLVMMSSFDSLVQIVLTSFGCGNGGGRKDTVLLFMAKERKDSGVVQGSFLT